MATFKFYIKGTDEKVRTSKTHHYTHYVAGQCCGSYMLAVKARDVRVAARYPRETAEDIINGGYYKVCARNLEEAREHLDWHDEQFGQEKGRNLVSLGYIRGLKFYGAKATEAEIAHAKQNIVEREELRARLKIEELEERV